jgi:hypothetical protein
MARYRNAVKRGRLVAGNATASDINAEYMCSRKRSTVGTFSLTDRYEDAEFLLYHDINGYISRNCVATGTSVSS